MCLSFGRTWTILQILWSTVYVICGAAQLMVGIFFTVTVHELQLYSILVAGSWNIIFGITGSMVSCITLVSPKRQEAVLYMAVSILLVNAVSFILTEWEYYFSNMPRVLHKYSNHVLIDYAYFTSRIAVATVLIVSFVDSQLAFCSMQAASRRPKKKTAGSHEHVSDIEYIIPRPKSSKPHHTVYNAYAQSWVFDAGNAGCSSTGNPEAPYLKILQNAEQDTKTAAVQNGVVKEIVENPVVHVEEASDDSTSNSDRKICHMKSFSRATTPVVLSASSSQISLNLNPNPNPPIYECLEKLTEPTIYRSRLNTAVSNRDEEEIPYQSPHVGTRREPLSPHVEKVQYASLMKELQRAIVSKKEPPSATSPESTTSESDKTQSSTRSETKSSDAEFSKELEAALQLIQDLESPNTAETPSETKSLLEKEQRPLAVWRNSDSDKTLNEITSPLAECQPELTTFKANGKSASIVVRYPDSQSTSGYSSPTHGPTPNWSTTSSVNGSSNDMGYSIHNAKTTTVISLYSTPSSVNQPKTKAVTLVKITGDEEALARSNQDDKKLPVKSAVWSLLRKKRQSSLPKLCPELEGAIVKSESLAYLSEVELLERHQRNKEIQREIEERVIQQLGVPRSDSESNC